jgi:hypothetical protein
VAVLEFVADPAALLREAQRVSRHRVAVIVLTKRSWLGIRRRVRFWFRSSTFSAARFFTRKRLRAIAEQVGVKPTKLRSALFLPAWLAVALPRLEFAWSRHDRPGGGILGVSIPGSRDRETHRGTRSDR